MPDNMAHIQKDNAGMLENMILLVLVVPEIDRARAGMAIAEYVEGSFANPRYVIPNAITRLERSAGKSSKGW